MAAELVGGAFLSASLDLLFERMAWKEVIDFVRWKKLNQELLNKLNDAEKKHLTDPDVRRWLHYLKDAIYDVENLAYEINTEALECELELGQYTTWRKVKLFKSILLLLLSNVVKNVRLNLLFIVKMTSFILMCVFNDILFLFFCLWLYVLYG